MNYKIDMCTLFNDTRKLSNVKETIFFKATGKEKEHICEEYNSMTTKSEALINLLKFLESEDVKSIKIEYEKKSI